MNQGHFSEPKSRKTQSIPMTERLASALAEHRHLNPWVCSNPNGTWLRRPEISWWLAMPRVHD